MKVFCWDLPIGAGTVIAAVAGLVWIRILDPDYGVAWLLALMVLSSAAVAASAVMTRADRGAPWLTLQGLATGVLLMASMGGFIFGGFVELPAAAIACLSLMELEDRTAGMAGASKSKFGMKGSRRLDVTTSCLTAIAAIGGLICLAILNPAYPYPLLVALTTISGSIIAVSAIRTRGRPTGPWLAMRGLATGILSFVAVAGFLFGGFVEIPAALLACGSVATGSVSAGRPD